MSLWSRESVLQLAADDRARKAAQKQASPGRWIVLERNDRGLWGEIKGSGKNPYDVYVDLRGPGFKCSCPSRQFPCKHGVGLLLIFADNPGALAQGDTLPAGMEVWIEGRDARAKKPKAAKPKKAVDAKAQARRLDARQAKVADGVAELRTFLDDLLIQGLAAAERSANAFDVMAARLTDNQAPGLAARLRAFHHRLGTGDGWQQDILSGMARLNLILSAYERRQHLPEDLLIDVRTRIGFPMKKEQVLEGGDVAARTVRDRWVVLGQRHVHHARVTEQRLWLWGLGTDRVALVLEFLPLGRPPEVAVVPGREIDAELVFYPGVLARRALVRERFGDPRPVDQLPAFPDFETALRHRAENLARTPWQADWPLAVDEVRPHPGNTGWTLSDREGRVLPLKIDDDLGWSALAIASRQRLGVFGEWRGGQLLPLSWWTEETFFQVVTLSETQQLSRLPRRIRSTTGFADG